MTTTNISAVILLKLKFFVQLFHRCIKLFSAWYKFNLILKKKDEVLLQPHPCLQKKIVRLFYFCSLNLTKNVIGNIQTKAVIIVLTVNLLCSK
jgi:hypothetical protein